MSRNAYAPPRSGAASARPLLHYDRSCQPPVQELQDGGREVLEVASLHPVQCPKAGHALAISEPDTIDASASHLEELSLRVLHHALCRLDIPELPRLVPIALQC